MKTMKECIFAHLLKSFPTNSHPSNLTSNVSRSSDMHCFKWYSLLTQIKQMKNLPTNVHSNKHHQILKDKHTITESRSDRKEGKKLQVAMTTSLPRVWQSHTQVPI